MEPGHDTLARAPAGVCTRVDVWHLSPDYGGAVMGPYCDFCDHRCFVLRRLPDDATGKIAGVGEILMATCQRGMAHDLEQTGYTHKTAINPCAPHLSAGVESGLAARPAEVR